VTTSIDNTATHAVNEFQVYITNIPFTAKQGHIAKFFDNNGIADIRIPKDKDDKPRGICFVDFNSKAAATRALKLNGQKLQGRVLDIVVSDKCAAEGAGHTGPGEQPEDCRTLFVKNLAFKYEPKELRKHLGKKVVKEVRPFLDKETGDVKGMAYVEFNDPKGAAEGMKHNGSIFEGRALKMDWTANKDDAMNAKYHGMTATNGDEGNDGDAEGGQDAEEEWVEGNDDAAEEDGGDDAADDY